MGGGRSNWPGDHVHILNSCRATVTVGWSPTAAPITGAGFGAAGLLLRAPRPDGTPAVLLQHRAVWSHQGGTWGLPGGARDSHETPEETAVREAQEEAGLLGRAADRAVDGGHRRGRRARRRALDLHHRGRRRGRAAAHRAQPGERRDALGRRGRGGRAAAASRLRGQLATAAHGQPRWCRWATPTNDAGTCHARSRSRPGSSSGACRGTPTRSRRS